jgi:DNA polymerase lambda
MLLALFLGVILKLVKELVAQGIICHTVSNVCHYTNAFTADCPPFGTKQVSTPSDWAALDCKWMGTGRLTPSSKLRRIDILATPHEQYGAALIYFTGNDRFNRSLRYYANRQGYSLNQRGLYKGVLRDANRVKQTEGTLVASKTEQDIFDVLRIRWRPPHLRRP